MHTSLPTALRRVQGPWNLKHLKFDYEKCQVHGRKLKVQSCFGSVVFYCRPQSVLCHDGVTREIVFDMLFITADHQEAQTHMGVAGSARASFPCVTCECPLSAYGELDNVGIHRSFPTRGRDAHWELQREMTATLEGLVDTRRARGVAITDSLRASLAIGVEKRLGKPLSRRMGTLAAWEEFWCVQQGGDEELFTLVSADCLHTVEEGLTVHLREAHQKFLQETYPDRWQVLAEELDACLMEVGKQQRWPGWRLPAGHKRFFAAEERFTATELASIRMVSTSYASGMTQGMQCIQSRKCVCKCVGQLEVTEIEAKTDKP
jgi:hypothetical protein